MENEYDYEWKKIDAELLRISEEKELLADAEYEQLSKVKTTLNEDIVALNFKIAAKDILEELPILYCPNYLSELSEDTIAHGLCENCNGKTIAEKILNSATLKKTLNDSISEAQELLVVKRNILHQNEAEIDRLEKEIQKERRVSDREMYKKELANAKFFEELTIEKKLLR